MLRRPVTLGWLGGFALFFGLLNLLLFAVAYLFYPRRRHLGHQHSGGLGLRHRQLRVVDRYRPRGNADFGDSAAAQAGLAQLDQPLCRGDDAVCRGLRRHVPAACTRAVRGWPTGCSPIPTPWECGRSSAARCCGTSLRFPPTRPFRAVLVRRTDSRSGDLPRHGDEPGGQDHLRIAGHGLARLGAALEALRERLPAAGRTGDAAGALGAHGGVLRLRRFDSAGLAHHGLSALFCRRRNLFGLCHGAGAGHSDPQVLRRART